MIGLIPAAGNATRINGLPKFLLPIPGDTYLLDILRRRMAQAGASPLLIGVNSRNIGFIERYAAEYATIHECNTATMSATVLLLGLFTREQPVLFAMPDTYWTDEQVFTRLAADIQDGALVSAALFETRPEQRGQLGMCAVAFDAEDEQLHITRVDDKPDRTRLHLAWGALAWRPAFWNFIQHNDPHVGYALARAVKAGVKARAYLAYGAYWDCGTANEYFACIRAEVMA